MVSDVAAEAGIGAADVACEITVHSTADPYYTIVLTFAIPEVEAVDEMAGALAASIKLLPEFEGASFALTSITTPTTSPSAMPATAPTLAPTAASSAMPTAAPSSMPTAAPSAMPRTAPTTLAPTLQPTVTKGWVKLQLSAVFDCWLTETKVTDICNAIVSEVSTIPGVEERDVACDMKETGSLRRRLLAVFYDLTVTFRVPEKDPAIETEVVLILAKAINNVLMMAEIGGTAELVSFTEEGEDTVNVAVSTASEAAPSLLLAVPCLLALMLHQDRE